VACWTADYADPRHRPNTPPSEHTTEENIMEKKLMEWGPAHLRDEATRPEVELADRPDDN
jgi:hypothetical protein